MDRVIKVCRYPVGRASTPDINAEMRSVGNTGKVTYSIPQFYAVARKLMLSVI